ncbi:MAG TPA: hypothetical protein PLC80_06270 [Draconibacterium sp.]|nr:hypothetical protein [Draconibacterium sp.]
MKSKLTKKLNRLLIIIIILLFCNRIHAQTKNNGLIISGIASHYIHKQNYREDTRGYYNYPVDPGFEILYFRKIRETVYLGAGYNYQTGRIASVVDFIMRFQFSEQNLPIVIRKEFSIKEKTYWFSSSGFYFGRNETTRVESLKKNGNWSPPFDMELVANYYDDNNFIDFYIDTGFCYSLNNWSEISTSAFLKYRIDKTWLNYHESRTHYGIKLSYNLKF